MSSKIALWTGLIGIGATISFLQPIASAKSSIEISRTAKAITVLINESDNQGSGVILQQQGDIYTVLTAAHVVKNKGKAYKITTPDDKSYQIISGSIRTSPGNIDLAVVKFKSATKYPTAKLGNCNLLESGMDLYVAGFPAITKVLTQSVLVFREGKVSANSNKIFDAGYSLVYSNDTLPGMSGGAVLNSEGDLVAIHGRGDREQSNGESLGKKTGFNVGIPINRFATVATKMGVDLGGQVAPVATDATPKADDYLISAAQKDRKNDFRGSLADLDRAIQLNPNNAAAYNNRGNLKSERLQDAQGGLADLNRAIQLDPKFVSAYDNRGALKAFKLQDIQGGLADINRAIKLNPNYASAYNNRGLLKVNKLQDTQGGLSDMNRGIQLDPNDSIAYTNRGDIKAVILQDIQGALTDYKQAIQVNPYNAVTYNNRASLKAFQLQDIQGGFTDVNRAIQLDPKYASAYSIRGFLKVDKLQDTQGGLADISRAIQLDPNNAIAYTLRGTLKQNKLQDIQGALADYSRAIQLDPNGVDAYVNRGVLKYDRLNDKSGGIVDMQKAAKLYQQQGNNKYYQLVIDQLKKWKGAK